MAYETQKAIIQDEIDKLSAEFSVSPPEWDIIEGRTSIFAHDTKKISFSIVALDIYNETKLRKLVRHEFMHYIQNERGIYPYSRRLREIQAESWAIQRTKGMNLPKPILSRPTPAMDVAVVGMNNPDYAGRVALGWARGIDSYDFDEYCSCCCR